jgi:leucyl-tRNA synthetase
MINSGFLNGLEVMEAIAKAIDVLEEKGLGKRRINYKLRDAIYSRQRYWGEPFPVYYDAQGVCHTLSVRELPLELPDLDDFKPGSGAASPLARVPQWVNLENGSRRETDTMPGFAGSSWYFLRYMDPQNSEAFASPDALNYWKDVDLYIGGTEHAVGHLMYSRFWHKFLYDKGLVPTLEPFRKLFNQGMIQGIIESVYFQKSTKHFISAELAKNYDANDLTQILVHVDFVTDYGNMDNSHLNTEGMAKFRAWRPEYADTQFILAAGSDKLYTVSEVGKMSKSKYNVINPDDIVGEYGADVFRLYEMFLGPIEQSKPWNTKGISGVAGFMRKWWSLHFDASGSWAVNDETPTEKEYKALHTCIKKVSEDIDRLSMNTCVSAFMICANELKELGCRKRAILEPLCILIAPFAVHTAEELWHHMGHEGSVHQAQWPAFEAKYLVESTVTYPVSINGKKRALVELPANADKAALESTALTLPEIIKWTEGKEIKKIIVVPGKMINLVVNE